jgi:hypothetical protein
MARTNAGAVQKILMKDYDFVEIPTLQPFIESASAVVDRVVTCAINKGLPLTGTETELIERWLAAHFYAVSDKPYSSRSTDKASANFAGQTGMYLEFTQYGQQAVTLDWSGCLAALTKRNRASMDWLGKAPSAQIDYTDRD